MKKFLPIILVLMLLGSLVPVIATTTEAEASVYSYNINYVVQTGPDEVTVEIQANYCAYCNPNYSNDYYGRYLRIWLYDTNGNQLAYTHYVMNQSNWPIGSVQKGQFTFSNLPVSAGQQIVVKADTYCSWCGHWAPPSKTITIAGNNSQVIYTGDTSGRVGTTANVSATLIDTSTNSPMTGKTLTFTLGSIATASAVTDANGVATTTMAIPSSASAGVYDMVTRFAGDASHFPNSDKDPFTVITNQAPTANAGPDQTVEQATLAGTTVTLNGSGSTDDGQLGPLTYSWTWAAGSATGANPNVLIPLGTTTITLTVDDGELTATDTVDITVEDTTAPVLTIPANITVEQETAAGTVVDLVATATDVCDTEIDIESDAPAIFPLGTTTVTFTATDDAGNSTTASMTVTVEDTTAPVFTSVPEDITVEQESLAGTVVDLVATATDICDAEVDIESNAPAIFPLGTTTVTFTATDDAGNSTTVSMTVTVEDTTAPILDMNCVDGVNPHGNIVPGKNRDKNGNGTEKNINPDGFYEVSFNVTDICDATPQVYVGTDDTPCLFNITSYADGVVIKFTECKEEPPVMKKIGSPANGGATAVTWHIILPCDPVFTAVDFTGNMVSITDCLVPPSPM